MANHIHFVAKEFQWLEEAIQFGAERKREVEIEYVVEVVSGITHHGIGIGIPLLTNLVGVHAVVERDGWCHIQILKQVECGIDWQGVRHTVAPIFHKAFLEKFVLFRGERVLETAGI